MVTFPFLSLALDMLLLSADNSTFETLQAFASKHCERVSWLG